MKKCCRCKLEKEFIDFNKNKANKNGLADYCKPCTALYRTEQRDSIRKTKKKYRDNNKEKRKLDQNQYRAKDRTKASLYNAKYTYGLEAEEYIKLISKAHCEICKTINSGKKAFHVDHCHQTGKVRGLLCNKCNLALGGFNDNKDLLTAAIKYLDKKDFL